MKTILKVMLPAMLFFACERDIEVDLPPYERKLVVNGLIDNISPIAVSVSHSVGALDSFGPGFIGNATVILYEDGIELETLSYDNFENKYISSHIGKGGSEYRIQVISQNYPTIEARTVFPGGNLQTAISFQDSTGTDEAGAPTGTLTIQFNDPVGEDNYYKLNLFYYNGSEFIELQYESNDASLLSGVEQDDGSVIFGDLLFAGKTKELRVTIPYGFASSTPRFLVDFASLGEEYYKYRTSLQKYRNSYNNPFAEPVFLYTNITNGLGIFAAQYNQRDTVF